MDDEPLKPGIDDPMAQRDIAKFSEEEIENAEVPGQKWVEGDKNIDWSQICYVRSMKYDPIVSIDSDGKQEIVVPTALTATGGKVKRVTSHWTMNHCVCPHVYGGGSVKDDFGEERSWINPKYFIVTPAEATNNLNGLPYNVLSVDTYWKRDIVLPSNAVLINFTGESLNASNVREVLVDAHSNREPIDIVEEIIAKLGYSAVSGSDAYVNDRNFDLAVSELAIRESLNCKTHFYSDDRRVDAPHFTLRDIRENIKSEFESGNFDSFFNDLRNFYVLSKAGMEKERSLLLPEIGIFLKEYYQKFTQKDIDSFAIALSYLPEEIQDEILANDADEQLSDWYAQRKVEANAIYQKRCDSEELV